MGIKQERADELIEAVVESYKDNEGDINAVIDDIKDEKLSENEAIFAYYAMGCIKTKREMTMVRGIEGIDGLIEMLEKAMKE